MYAKKCGQMTGGGMCGVIVERLMFRWKWHLLVEEPNAGGGAQSSSNGDGGKIVYKSNDVWSLQTFYTIRL